MRCYLLLCGVHGIRSGFAARLTPNDLQGGELKIQTKYGAVQTIGITHDLALLLQTCKLPDVPFVAQLPRGQRTYFNMHTRDLPVNGRITKRQLHHDFRKLCGWAGITRNIRLHDMRRTTARNIYRLTGDLRDAQHLLGHAGLASTIWYLQDEVSRVPASLLELARVKPTTEVTQ